jgi:hypothetical protein
MENNILSDRAGFKGVFEIKVEKKRDGFRKN